MTDIDELAENYARSAFPDMSWGYQIHIKNAYSDGAMWALEHQWQEIGGEAPPCMRPCLFMDVEQRYALGYFDTDGKIRIPHQQRLGVDIESLTHFLEIPDYEY